LTALIEAANVAERVFKRTLTGKLMHAGLMNRLGSANVHAGI